MKPRTRTLTDFKAHIMRLCEFLRGFFHVTDHRWSVVWDIEADPSGQMSTGASIEIGHPYLEFRITVYKPLFDMFVKDKRDREICRLIAHEFAHILTDDLRTLARESVHQVLVEQVRGLNETLVDKIAYIAMYDIKPSVYKFHPPVVKKAKSKCKSRK